MTTTGSRQWVAVARTGEVIADQPLGVEAAGRQLVVVRNGDAFCAYEGRCPHQLGCCRALIAIINRDPYPSVLDTDWVTQQTGSITIQADSGGQIEGPLMGPTHQRASPNFPLSE